MFCISMETNNLLFLTTKLVFPGQGSQWLGCGISLYETEPIFRSAVDTVDAYFCQISGKSLKAIMFSCSSQDELDQCDVAQPFNFMIQVGLVELCRSIGIHPTCIVGHSAGELAAAYASGAIPLKVC
jgi:acyl transferase domain-containing protein